MDIVQRHTQGAEGEKGKFNLANALTEIDERLAGLEEAMAFFSNWYNKTQRTEIIVPEHLAGDNDKPKLIL